MPSTTEKENVTTNVIKLVSQQGKYTFNVNSTKYDLSNFYIYPYTYKYYENSDLKYKDTGTNTTKYLDYNQEYITNENLINAIGTQYLTVPMKIEDSTGTKDSSPRVIVPGTKTYFLSLFTQYAPRQQ